MGLGFPDGLGFGIASKQVAAMGRDSCLLLPVLSEVDSIFEEVAGVPQFHDEV